MGKKKNFYLGLDIGTDSVGWAVTDEEYHLLKFNGEPAWGSTIFDAGSLKAERRSFRSARRRLDRRQQRVLLLQEIFAKEIAQVDERFFIRLQESYKYREDTQDNYVFFDDDDYTDKDYFQEYPTIHHLICELMESNEPHDVRLLYLACAWLVSHRGHFLSNIDVDHMDDIRDVKKAYEELVAFYTDNGFEAPFRDVDVEELGNALKEKTTITSKKTKLTQILLHGQKASKEINEDTPYSVEAIIRLLSGSNVNLKDIFGKEEYEQLEPNSISLGMDEEKYAAIMSGLDEDFELIARLRAIYDWAVLADTLGEFKTISAAKKAIYEQHEKDLKTLKYFIQKYAPDYYDDIFRNGGKGVEHNYVAYSYNTKGLSEKKRQEFKKSNQVDFCKYIFNIVKEISPEESDMAAYEDMIARLGLYTFMPKQKNTDNRVIPNQLYLYELKKILEQASNYCPFLLENDEDGISAKNKIISIFNFKLPYYVGPLNTHSEHAWMVRKAEGKILPWNYDKLIDFDASEEAFIRRLTNTCTYMAGEKVLPKDSLCYQKFMVLNEINNIRVNNEKISVELKQEIYHQLFERKRKVRRKDIEEYLISNSIIVSDEKENVTGIDTEIKASLSSFHYFNRILNDGILSETEVEKIIERASYAEDKGRLRKWLKKEYPQLSEDDLNYVSRCKAKDFGRLSKAFLTQLEGADTSTGEIATILGLMWNTNNNLMELLSEQFTFKEELKKWNMEYYEQHPMTLEGRLDEMYVSNAVRRPIYRTLAVVNDIKRAFGEPSRIFIEMTRGEDASKKGKRTSTRYQQIEEIYNKCKDEDVRELKHQLEAMGEIVDSKLQSDRLFLYFTQMGRCAYSGTSIDLEKLMSGSKDYDIDHIYPQAFVKDDSIIQNKVLVLSVENGKKKDEYPIKPSVQGQMRSYWDKWRENGCISDEKYKRLTRTTPFTDEERYGFINRQLTETSQSTKAAAQILADKFPDADIVYTRARLTSEFRHEFNLPKSRSYNDLHHAVDAYLNIVTGNVYDMMFSRKRFSLPVDNKYSIKTKTIFGDKQRAIGDKIYWDGQNSLSLVIKTARKNNAHFTKFAYLKEGKLFDQPEKKRDELISLKKGLPSKKYGGYNSPKIMFFLPVRYIAKKKNDIIIMPVEVMYGKRVLEDIEYAKSYTEDRLEKLLGKKIDKFDFPFGMRPWKINTVLSLDGFRVCITGNASGGTKLIVQNIMQFSLGEEWKAYIKKIEKYVEKNKANPKFVYDADYDVVTKEKNMQLYDLFIEKMKNSIYAKRINCPTKTLINGKNKFEELTILQQCQVLLNILLVFNRMTTGCDLTLVGGSKNSAATNSFSRNISTWRKNYTDIRVIDQSTTGLWEIQSENLLDAL